MHAKYLKMAIDLSADSVAKGGFPVGALIVKDGVVIAQGISNGKALRDPTSHAETMAIREACLRLQSRDLSKCTLYSSMAPCLMCLAASFWASLPRICYAIPREKLDLQHVEGKHDIIDINAHFRKPMELIHERSLEQSALDIVSLWEQSR